MSKKLMTAAELFEVVRDVPVEAWPPRVEFVAPEDRPAFWGENSSDACFDPDHACRMFEGAMMSELLKRNGVMTDVTGGGSTVLVRLYPGDNRETSDHTGPTLIHALAAACKDGA